MSLGTVLERLSRYDEAIEAYRDALAVAREPLQRAHLHVLWGPAEQGAHRYQEALGQCDAAEQGLGPAPERPEREWLTTWLAAQGTRMWVLYWMGDTLGSGRLIERVRPFIAVHGSAEQRANFFTNITLMSLRRDRFFVADETLGFARAAYAAAQEADPPYVGPVWPVFTLGFTLLWRGDLDEATEMLRDSLQEAERRGDATTRSRSLTYLWSPCGSEATWMAYRRRSAP